MWIHGAAGASVLLLSSTVREAVRSRRDHRQPQKTILHGMNDVQEQQRSTGTEKPATEDD